MPRVRTWLSRLLPGRTPETLAQKASATGPLIALETLGRPVWAPRDYQAFAREGFMQNAIVYRSVRMIAEAAASIPLLLYEGQDEIEAHPLIDLLAAPSPDQTGTDFLEAWYGYLLVAGNAYAEAVAIGGRVRELYALRPDRMKVVPGAEGWPEAYEYAAAGTSVRFASEVVAGVRPILHVRLFHPANDHYGMSPIEAAAAAIDIHNTAARWNKALLDNSARPSGALVYAASDGRLTAEQFERLKTELEQGFQGATRAGRPLLLEGGLDWKPLSLSPKDMDFVEAKNAAAREIALALGVPPMLLGIPGDNTYSNYQEATRSFWRQTVLPLVNRTAKALSAWLGPAWSGDLHLRPDLDQIEALSGEREALWARLERSGFVTLNEKRAAAGYGPHGDGDVLACTEPACLTPRSGVSSPPGRLPGVRPCGSILKYSPDQPRVPRGHSDGGQWTDAGGGSGASSGGSDGRVRSDANPADTRKPGAQIAQARGGRAPGRITIGGRSLELTPAQAARYSVASNRAQDAMRRVQERDPDWRPTPSLTETAEGAISAREAEAVEAEARLSELLRDAIPNTNPDWGMNRLRKELGSREYRFRSQTRAPGMLFENERTKEQVRIMQRPARVHKRDPAQKHLSDHYYRYRSRDDQPWGRPILIPNKK